MASGFDKVLFLNRSPFFILISGHSIFLLFECILAGLSAMQSATVINYKQWVLSGSRNKIEFASEALNWEGLV